jgi:hypothetical protein
MGSMRHLAVVVAAALVFALIAPAFAQPFADVPTNHWAYDAIAELAAKGLIEGYPDGTFKGDRAMTRYEMAMVVARLLARIESIQVPSPTAPQVTKADLDAIQRLVNEFRAELAALGVRVTAIEEELNAIKARLDNVRMTGGLRFREDVVRSTSGTISGVGAGAATGTTLNGNPRTSSTSASTAPFVNRPRYEFKLGFDGSVAPDIHYIVGLESTGTYQIFNSSNYGVGTTNGAAASIDSAFLDWRNAWGIPLEIMLGRFGNDTPCGGGCYPIQWGPFGLIMNDNGDTWEDTTGDSGVNVADGLRVQLHVPSAADLQFEAVILRIIGSNGTPFNPVTPGSYIFGEDAYGGNASVQIFPGLRVGADYVANTITPATGVTGPGGFGNIADWHIYGPGGGSFNPANTGALAASSYHCVPAGTIGIFCPALGSGWDGYLDWSIIPGITFDGEYAQWNDSVFSTSDNGWQVNVTWDLGTLLGIGHSFTITTGYLDFGQNFYTPYGAAEADILENDSLYPGNAQGWTATGSFKLTDAWRLYANYFSGNSVSNGQSLSTYEAGIVYTFAPQASIVFKARELSIAGVEQFTLYRAQIDYSF